MRFSFKISEIQYIQKKFHFGALIGVEKHILPFIGMEKSLLSAGVLIETNGKNCDLKPEYRYLFSAWEKMRYSVIRPDSNTKNEFFCVLANEKDIIIIDQVNDDVAIELVDFQTEVMDRVLLNMAQLTTSITVSDPFNIALAANDFTRMLSRKDNVLDEISHKIGLSKDNMSSFLKTVEDEERFIMFLCEDHSECKGSLIKIVETPDGLYALKHVTPKDNQYEKFVMMHGSVQDIIDSIYIF